MDIIAHARPKAIALAILFALALAGISPAQPAELASLRPSVTVDSAMIRLGDIFEGVSEKADRVIARAPRPGGRLTLEARWLWRVARSYGVDWRPASRLDTTVVERASVVVTAEQINHELSMVLRDRLGSNGEFELQFDNQLADIHLAIDAEPAVQVRSLEFDRRSGRFVATVTAGGSGRDAARLSTSGRLHPLVVVPVPTRRLQIGHIIRTRDIDWVTVRAGALDRNTLMDEADIFGQSARRTLIEGRPFRVGDVVPPVLVHKNSMVTIVLSTDTMELTAQGKALEEGAEGDVIRVENTQSRRTIEATITGINRVNVGSIEHLVMR